MFLRKRVRVALWAATLLGGGVVLQAGNCSSALVNFGLSAVDFCALTGNAQCTVGPFAPCGLPDYQFLDANGFPTGSVFNREDDILLDCPINFIQTPTN